MVFSSCTKIKTDKTESDKVSDAKQKKVLSSAGFKEGEAEFMISYAQPRRIYKIEKEDLNNDGKKEIIVLSTAKDSLEKYNDYYNFDMIEVFALDESKKAFAKILADTVDYADSCILNSLRNDSNRQILITTNSGGNNETMSKGLFIYDMTSPLKINLLKYFDVGAPEITDIKKDGNKEILVSDLYYGVMPQNSAVNFVKEIYKLENQKLLLKNEEFGEYYDPKIKELLERYYGIKRKVEMGMQLNDMSYPLYREAAELLVNYYAKGDLKGLKKFWDEEKESLKKNIPEEEFLDLSNFILKALPTAKNA